MLYPPNRFDEVMAALTFGVTLVLLVCIVILFTWVTMEILEL